MVIIEPTALDNSVRPVVRIILGSVAQSLSQSLFSRAKLNLRLWEIRGIFTESSRRVETQSIPSLTALGTRGAAQPSNAGCEPRRRPPLTAQMSVCAAAALAP